jgi:hypothetical protein
MTLRMRNELPHRRHCVTSTAKTRSSEKAERLDEGLGCINQVYGFRFWLGTFHDDGSESVARKPEGERGTGDARPRDQDGSREISCHCRDTSAAAGMESCTRALSQKK